MNYAVKHGNKTLAVLPSKKEADQYAWADHLVDPGGEYEWPCLKPGISIVPVDDPATHETFADERHNNNALAVITVLGMLALGGALFGMCQANDCNSKRAQPVMSDQ